MTSSCARSPSALHVACAHSRDDLHVPLRLLRPQRLEGLHIRLQSSHRAPCNGLPPDSPTVTVAVHACVGRYQLGVSVRCVGNRIPCSQQPLRSPCCLVVKQPLTFAARRAWLHLVALLCVANLRDPAPTEFLSTVSFK